MESKHYIIWESSDYDNFVRDHNRPVHQRHVDELIVSMQELGFLAEYPITVRPLGDGKFAVIDGQHRLAAAKQLGIPLYYIISQRIERKHVPILAGLAKNWKLEDWLGVFMDEGRPEYLQLQDFRRRYDDMPLAPAIALCQTGFANLTKPIKEAFKSGDFTCDHIADAEKVMSLAKSFNGSMANHWKQAQFVRALVHITNDPRYDDGRMSVRIKHSSTFVTPKLRTDDYLKELSELYNYKVAPEKKIAFTPAN